MLIKFLREQIILIQKKFEPLANRDFRRLLISKGTTSIGYWISFVAIFSKFVFETNIGPIGVGIFALVQLLPNVFSSFFFGPFADRFDRRKLLVFTEIVSAFLVLTLVFVNYVLVSYLVLFVLGLVKSLAGPTQKSMVAQIITKEEILPKANGIINGISTTAGIAGPGIGGLLLIVTTPESMFILDSVSYFLSAILILTMSKYTVKESTSRAHFGQLIDGFRYIRSSSIIISVIITNMLVFGLIGIFDAVFPLLIKENLLGTASDFSIIIGIVALGSLSGSGLMSTYGDQISSQNGIIIGTFMGGVSILCIGSVVMIGTNTSWVWIFVSVFAFFNGFGNSIGIGYSYTLIQQRTDNEYMGRTFSTFRSLTSFFEICLIMAGSFALTRINITSVYIFAGILLLSVSIILFVIRIVYGSIGFQESTSYDI